MTSVLYSSGGYNVGGNQLRTEIRTLQTRLDTLTSGLNGLKDLLNTLNPENTEVINAYFTNLGVPSSSTLPPPLPARPPPLPAAANRVRP